MKTRCNQKTFVQYRLSLKTRDTLMQVSLCGLEVDAMDWATISTFAETCKTEGYLCLTATFFLTNQDHILVIPNIGFSKILCYSNWGDNFRIRCICQLIFIFVCENIMWYFGFEVERQMKFVKHTHWHKVLDMYYKILHIL